MTPTSIEEARTSCSSHWIHFKGQHCQRLRMITARLNWLYRIKDSKVSLRLHSLDLKFRLRMLWLEVRWRCQISPVTEGAQSNSPTSKNKEASNTKPQHQRKNLQLNQHQKLMESGRPWSQRKKLSKRRWTNQVYIRKKIQFKFRLKRLPKVGMIWLPRLHHTKLEFQLMELKRRKKKKNLWRWQLRSHKPKFHPLSSKIWIIMVITSQWFTHKLHKLPKLQWEQ